MDKGEKYTDEQIALMEQEYQQHYEKTYKDLIKAVTPFLLSVKAFDKQGGTVIRRMLLLPSKRKIDGFAEIITSRNVSAGKISQKYAEKILEYNALFQWEKLPAMGGFKQSAYDRIKFEDVLKNIEKLFPDTLDKEKDKIWNSQRIRQNLIKSLNNGAGIDKMAKDLQEIMDINHASAVMRARTAATGAQNTSRMDALKYAEKTFGTQYIKIWDNSHDNRVRPSHVAVNGEKRRLNELFSNGLMYPGEQGKPWSEVANCRCAIRTERVK